MNEPDAGLLEPVKRHDQAEFDIDGWLRLELEDDGLRIETLPPSLVGTYLIG